MPAYLRDADVERFKGMGARGLSFPREERDIAPTRPRYRNGYSLYLYSSRRGVAGSCGVRTDVVGVYRKGSGG